VDTLAESPKPCVYGSSLFKGDLPYVTLRFLFCGMLSRIDRVWGIKRAELNDIGKVRKAQCSTHPLMVSEGSVLGDSYFVVPKLGPALSPSHMMTNTVTVN